MKFDLVDLYDSEWSSALHKAAFQGFAHCLEELLRSSTAKGFFSNNSKFFLYLKYLLVELEIAAGDSLGSTALHKAAFHGWDKCVSLLLEHSAPTTAKDKEGATPLHFACFSGSTKCVKYLIISHANVSDTGKLKVEEKI